MELFIVGKNISAEGWELQGVFSSKQLAIDACINEHYWWAGTITLDVPLPDATIEWKQYGYPIPKTQQ